MAATERKEWIKALRQEVQRNEERWFHLFLLLAAAAALLLLGFGLWIRRLTVENRRLRA